MFRFFFPSLDVKYACWVYFEDKKANVIFWGEARNSIDFPFFPKISKYSQSISVTTVNKIKFTSPQQPMDNFNN